MNAWRLDADGAQQALEREFHHFLRFAHDVGPAFEVEQGVERVQARFGAADVVGGEVAVLHIVRSAQAATTVQYG